MKIALCNRDETTHLGGDAIQVRAYQKSLQKLGHDVRYYGVLDPVFELGTEEVWLFHINFGWTPRQWRKVSERQIPYRIFNIYYPSVYSDTNHDLMYTMLRGAKAVYSLSSKEDEEFHQEFPDISTTIIPNGVDKDIFKANRTVNRKYVMTAGRYEGMKGQLRIIEVCAGLGLPALVIGSLGDTSYMNECKSKANPESLVLFSVSQTELAELYNQTKVYVCASTSERNNLCVLEAAQCGCDIINSTENRGKEWLLGTIAIDVTNPDILKQSILEAYNRDILPVYEVPSWDDIIQLILK